MPGDPIIAKKSLLSPHQPSKLAILGCIIREYNCVFSSPIKFLLNGSKHCNKRLSRLVIPEFSPKKRMNLGEYKKKLNSQANTPMIIDFIATLKLLSIFKNQLS